MRTPISEKIRRAIANRDKQTTKVAALKDLLAEQSTIIQRLNVESHVADVVRSVDLRQELDTALQKKTACLRQLEDETTRLASYNDQVEKCESQLEAAINNYVKACTTDVVEVETNAANLRNKAIEIMEKGELEAVRLETLAAQILKSKSTEELKDQAVQYQKMVARQRARAEEDAKMIRERADRSLNSIKENKALALSRLKFEGGQDAVERANEMIKRLNGEVKA